MNHLINYLKWRGDLSFEQSELNEVDRFALAYASYAELEKYIGREDLPDSAPFHEVALKYRKKKRRYCLEHPEWKQEEAFIVADRVFAEMSRTLRFQDMGISDYVQVVDPEHGEQFAAVCFRVSEHLRYVSVSGTDETVTGWLEDFQLSYLEEVPAQKRAGEYLLGLLDRYPEDSFFIGGHSKGGNLAIYAATVAAREGKEDRIAGVDSFDSPGFRKPFLESESFLKIREKIHAYVPEGGLVALLLFRNWDLTIVKNKRKTIPHQHICEGWEVLGTSFVRGESLRDSNVSMGITVQEAVTTLTTEELENMFNRISTILSEAGVWTVMDFSAKSGRLMSLAAHEYHQTDSEERSRIGKFLLAMIKIFNENKQERLGLPDENNFLDSVLRWKTKS